MLLLAGLLQAAAPSLSVTGIVRVTDAPGMRDNAIAAPGPHGTMVFWDESPGIDRSGAARPPVQIWRAVVPGTLRPVPRKLIATHGNQWQPALLRTARGGWLAWYSADARRRTGDRDIMLQPLDTRLALTGRGRRVTSDPSTTLLPLNDASPALARTSDGRVLLAWSRGGYDARAGTYADKDIVVAVVKPNGDLETPRVVTGRDEPGHEMVPALAALDRGRTLLAYISDSAAAGRYVLYVRTLDSMLRPGPPSRLTDPERGVSRPSFARAGPALWMSWYDMAASDIRIARVTGDSTLSESVSLRELLLKSGFERYGRPHAGLSGASLFADQDRLGVAFIATMLFDTAAGRARQDVFFAWLETD